MDKTSSILMILLLLNACATTPVGGVKRNRMHDCPPGLVQICETREQHPSKGGDDEIPEYETCYCEPVVP